MLVARQRVLSGGTHIIHRVGQNHHAQLLFSDVYTFAEVNNMLPSCLPVRRVLLWRSARHACPACAAQPFAAASFIRAALRAAMVTHAALASPRACACTCCPELCPPGDLSPRVRARPMALYQRGTFAMCIIHHLRHEHRPSIHRGKTDLVRARGRARAHAKARRAPIRCHRAQCGGGARDLQFRAAPVARLAARGLLHAKQLPQLEHVLIGTAAAEVKVRRRVERAMHTVLQCRQTLHRGSPICTASRQ